MLTWSQRAILEVGYHWKQTNETFQNPRPVAFYAFTFRLIIQFPHGSPDNYRIRAINMDQKLSINQCKNKLNWNTWPGHAEKYSVLKWVVRQTSVSFAKEITENWLPKFWASHLRAIPTDKVYRKVKRSGGTGKNTWREFVGENDLLLLIPAKGDKWESLQWDCFETLKCILWGWRAKWIDVFQEIWKLGSCADELSDPS